MGLISDIEFVNHCLSALGEDPVSEIDETDTLVQTILNTRLTEMKQLLIKGHSFNTEKGIVVAPTEDGYINVPENCLVASESSDTLMLVQRGNRMYSRKLHSYVVNASVMLDMILSLDWDELPAHAQAMIQARTAFKVFNDIVGSEFQSSKLEQSISDATILFQSAEDDVANYKFLDPVSTLTGFNTLQRNGVPSTYRVLY